jgi:hypothetical protein
MCCDRNIAGQRRGARNKNGRVNDATRGFKTKSAGNVIQNKNLVIFTKGLSQKSLARLKNFFNSA